MQYENNLRKKVVVFFSVKHKIWFSKSLFPKGTSGKRGVVLYSGQYGNSANIQNKIYILLKHVLLDIKCIFMIAVA